jgi:glutamine amidotransferase PdxT
LFKKFNEKHHSGQKTGGQELVGGLDCTVHRNFFGSQVMHVFDVASFVG